MSRDVFLLGAEEARIEIRVGGGVLLGAAALVGDVGVLLMDLLLALAGLAALLVLALAAVMLLSGLEPGRLLL